MAKIFYLHWNQQEAAEYPTIFVGGKAEKNEAIRQKFSRAIFCAKENLPAALASLPLQNQTY